MSEPVDPKIKVVGTLIDPVKPVGPSPTASGANQLTADGIPYDKETLEFIGLLAPRQAAGELGRLAHFRILKKLGAGGMGMVLLAEDINLLRLVALKIMLPRHAQSVQAKERFLREARVAARIQHDHVVTILSVGEDRGIPFIAMELLKGAPLDDYLDEKKAVSLTQALRIGREIAEGLQAAHAVGLVHRDIKPANIWLEVNRETRASAKYRVKILDFGLARDVADEIKLTHTGAVIGTPAYMSPEQASGESLDHRTDLFSLGIVLYELVTGQLPFRKKTVLAMMCALKDDPHPPIGDINPKAPAGLIALIDKLLAKAPQDRPQTAQAVAEALAELERPAVRPDGKPVPEVLYVPMATSVVADPFADIDATSSEFENRAGSRKRPVDDNQRDRESTGESTRKSTGRLRDPARRRWVIPAACGVALLLALLVFALVPRSKPVPTGDEFKSPDSTTIAKIDPPKKITVVAPPVSGDPKGSTPKEIAKVEPPVSRDPTPVNRDPTPVNRDPTPVNRDPTPVNRDPKGSVVTPPQPPITKGDETSYDLGNGVKLDVIKIAAKGKSFLMGSPKDEPDRSDDEEQHEVTFAHDFSMGKYEVTQEQYEAIMGMNPSRSKGAKNPVEMVSWDDAQEFIEKLNMKFKDQKVKFRLPSEAEWEYACRAGMTATYNTGKTLTKEQAAIDGSSTKTVGSYAANAFGLHDMHGNVYEWCEDCYGPYSKAPKDGTAQTIKQESDRRVLRGGSWSVISRYCRAAYRNIGAPDSRGYIGGFRVVVVSP